MWWLQVRLDPGVNSRAFTDSIPFLSSGLVWKRGRGSHRHCSCPNGNGASLPKPVSNHPRTGRDGARSSHMTNSPFLTRQEWSRPESRVYPGGPPKNVDWIQRGSVLEVDWMAR